MVFNSRRIWISIDLTVVREEDTYWNYTTKYSNVLAKNNI